LNPLSPSLAGKPARPGRLHWRFACLNPSPKTGAVSPGAGLWPNTRTPAGRLSPRAISGGSQQVSLRNMWHEIPDARAL